MLGAPRIGASGAVQPFYNRQVASGPPPPSFVTVATHFVDNQVGNANPTFTVGPVTIQAGDLLVVAIGTNGGVAEPTASVDGGGAPVSTEVVTIQTGFGTRSCIFTITGAAAGARTVTIVGPGAAGVTPVAMAGIVYVLRGASATPFDKSATATVNSAGPYSVGPTAALTQSNQFDIAALAIMWENDGTNNPIPWASPFTDRAHDGPIGSGGGDVTLWCADSISPTTAAVTATSGANPGGAQDTAMVVATFKHA